MAILVLIARGLIERPDRIVMADTRRENQSTWDYLDEVAQPYAAAHDLAIEIAPGNLAYVDLYGHNGDLLIPVYTKTGKLTTFCSSEWKSATSHRYLTLTMAGVEHIETLSHDTIKSLMRSTPAVMYTTWIGFALEERRRIKDTPNKRYPLIEMNLTTHDALRLVRDAGLPEPPHSSCYMCPNKRNAEWRDVRDHYPVQWRAAVALDTELRADDEAAYDLADDTTRAARWPKGPGVWLHRDRVPLALANLDTAETQTVERQCGLGLCFV